MTKSIFSLLFFLLVIEGTVRSDTIPFTLNAEQEDAYDVAKEAIFDPYSTPNHKGLVQKDSTYIWNELNYADSSRQAKLNAFLDKQDENKIDELDYETGVFNCTNFSLGTCISFTGLENFQNYTSVLGDSSLYGSRGIENDVYGMPVYYVSNKNKDHAYNTILMGESLTNFEDLYFFEPQNDKKVEIGNWRMENGDIIRIKGFYYDEEADSYYFQNLITFEIENDSAKIQKYYNPIHKDSCLDIDPLVFRQNPHHAVVDLEEQDDVVIEADGSEVDLSADNIGWTNMNTTLGPIYYDITNERLAKDYTPTRTYSDSIIEQNENYPIYQTRLRTEYAEGEMGNWNASNLSNLGDTVQYKVKVEDTTAPELEVSDDEITAPKGADVTKQAKSLVNYVSDASTSYGYPIDTTVINADSVVYEDANYTYYEPSVYTTDVSGNSSDTIPLEIKVEKYSSGLNQKTAKEMLPYPNPTTGKVNFNYSAGGQLDYKIYSLSGKLMGEGSDVYSAGDKIELDISGVPGIYIIQVLTVDETLYYRMVKK